MEKPTTKEEKVKQLQESGVLGKKADAKILEGFSHAQLDHLIESDSTREVPGANPKDLEEAQAEIKRLNEELGKVITREKYDDEVVRRRTAESNLNTYKKSVKAAAENLASLK